MREEWKQYVEMASDVIMLLIGAGAALLVLAAGVAALGAVMYVLVNAR